ncbi:unnamed protein product [Orchesella dallaii]|uniref:Uncharacterized protein n=1 Tax=Orchesella dallaii TaxID=48710 RepID=A0ABP1RQJ3_9HEXA
MHMDGPNNRILRVGTANKPSRHELRAPICPYLTVLAFLSICVCGNQTYAETDDPSITTNFYDPRYHDYGRNHLRDTKPLISDATITGSSNKIRIFQNVANSGSYTPSSSSIKTNIDNYYGPNRKIKMRFTNPTLMEKHEVVRSPHSAKYNYEDYYPHQNFHYPLRQSFQGFSLPYLYKSTKTIPKTDIPRYSHGFSTIYPAYSYGEENWYNPEPKDSDSASKDLFSNSNPLNLIYKGPILPSHPKKSTPVIKSSYYTDLSPYIAGYPSGFSKGML